MLQFYLLFIGGGVHGLIKLIQLPHKRLRAIRVHLLQLTHQMAIMIMIMFNLAILVINNVRVQFQNLLHGICAVHDL